MDNCQNEMADSLFDPKFLEDLNTSNFVGKITRENLANHLKMRPLCLSDYEKGYMKLLSELTTVGNVSLEQFQAGFNAMKCCKNSYYIIVIEDINRSLIIGSATLLVEQKFIHSASTRGRIEDVVVNNEYRGQHLGKLLLDVLIESSKKVGCYKVSLECKTGMMPFYNRFGLYAEEDNNYLVLRFKD
ncbi:glucosamine 6-phosphate N-acetyltransferase-like isoform X1 [Argonauta hians]